MKNFVNLMVKIKKKMTKTQNRRLSAHARTFFSLFMIEKFSQILDIFLMCSLSLIISAGRCRQKDQESCKASLNLHDTLS